MFERGYDGMRAYSHSKIALVTLTFDLAEELAGTGATAGCLHPPLSWAPRWYSRPSVTQRVPCCRRAATRRFTGPPPPDFKEVTDKYFDQEREARVSAQAYDPEARNRLWWLSEELPGCERLAGAHKRFPPHPFPGLAEHCRALVLLSSSSRARPLCGQG